MARDVDAEGDEPRQQARRRRSRRIGLRRLLAWVAFLPVASRAPLYGRLIWELVREDRIPARRKALLVAALAYVALGRDIVADDVPVLGGIDDLVVVVLAVELFLDGVPEDLLHEKLDALGIDRREFEQDVARIRRFMPRTVRRMIRRLPRVAGLAGNALRRSNLGPRVRAWINEEGSIA